MVKIKIDEDVLRINKRKKVSKLVKQCIQEKDYLLLKPFSNWIYNPKLSVLPIHLYHDHLFVSAFEFPYVGFLPVFQIAFEVNKAIVLDAKYDTSIEKLKKEYGKKFHKKLID
jgi:hypothetical protein